MSGVINKLKIGVLTIRLPDESKSTFRLKHDLAQVMGLEYNHEAMSLLKKALGDESLSNEQIEVTHEADAVYVETPKANHMARALEVLLRVASAGALGYSAEDISDATKAMNRHVRPPATPWKVGDVFAISMADETFGFGQVLGKHLEQPTCALFDARADRPLADIEEVVTSPTIAILHCDAKHLLSGRWQVIGNAPPVNDPWSGPCGHRSFGRTWGGLGELAEAWFGLRPWNGLSDAKFYEGFLLPGVKRPEKAKVLSPEERTRHLSQMKSRFSAG